MIHTGHRSEGTVTPSKSYADWGQEVSYWFDEIITPSERKELEEAVRQINFVFLRGTIVCLHIKGLISQRMGPWAK